MRHRSDGEAIRRIKGAVTRTESQPYAFGKPTRQPRLAGWVSIRPGIVTAAISAASGTTPGSGSVQPYDGDGNTVGDPVDVLNWYTASGTVAVDKHCMIGFDGKDWWLMEFDC